MCVCVCVCVERECIYASQVMLVVKNQPAKAGDEGDGF